MTWARVESGLILDFFIDVFHSDPYESSFTSPRMEYPDCWPQMSHRQHDDSLRMTELNERTWVLTEGERVARVYRQSQGLGVCLLQLRTAGLGPSFPFM